MMKKIIAFISVIFFFVGIGKAQNVGINATGAAPDNSSMLDVSSTNSGMLIPRMTIAQRNAIGGPATGLLIYQTNSNPGFYYWDGAQWVRLFGGDAWQLDGNAGTNPTNNFVGTTDNQALRIRTNNANRFEFATDGRLRSFNSGSAGAPTYSWTTDTDIGMYRIGANVLGFSTAGTERIRIAADGDVGVGVNAPLARLHIDYGGTTQGGLYSEITAGASNWPAIEGFNPNTGNGTGVVGTGYYGIYGQITNPAGWAGFFDGDVGCTGNYFGSDRRFKENIKNIESTIDKVKEIKVYTYNYSQKYFNENNSRYGFIAQEIQGIFPDLVKEKGMPTSSSQSQKENSDDSSEVSKFLFLNYTDMIPILTKAIQEQQEQIESLEQRIERLEKLIEEK